MRIVAVKRRKQVRGGPADQALLVTGRRHAGIAPTAVKQAVKPFKTYLVEEYATLRGQDVPTSDEESNRMFDAAVQYIHVNLLQDLSPPWMEKDFAQALPGEGVLSRYLKPCFLKWDIASAGVLFGEVMTRTLSHAANSVGCTAVSIVGRPLYVCTQPSGTGVCGRVAAMSPLMEQRGDQKVFMCRWCKHYNAALPVSGSRPRRVMQLYLQVRVAGGAITFMRTKPLRIMVAAPTSAWGTGDALPASSCLPVAMPTTGSDTAPVHFVFSEAESEAIWLHAVSL